MHFSRCSIYEYMDKLWSQRAHSLSVPTFLFCRDVELFGWKRRFSWPPLLTSKYCRARKLSENSMKAVLGDGEDGGGRRRVGSCLQLFSGLVWLGLLTIYYPGIRATSEEGHQLSRSLCKNTVQGRYLLSDDHGYVCGVMSVDPSSGCCPESSEQFSCHGCNLISQCCDSYEFCVSCCLNPTRTLKELAMKVKVAKQATAGTYGSAFDFCTGRCRHNSASVVHENAYASEMHHCFSLQSNSSGLNNPHSEVELSDISILVGRQGQSCNSVCKSRGQSCIVSRLTALNKCGVLQKYMNCKGACVASLGPDHPAEVTDNAPRHLSWACNGCAISEGLSGLRGANDDDGVKEDEEATRVEDEHGVEYCEGGLQQFTYLC